MSEAATKVFAQVAVPVRGNAAALTRLGGKLGILEATGEKPGNGAKSGLDGRDGLDVVEQKGLVASEDGGHGWSWPSSARRALRSQLRTPTTRAGVV